MKFLPTCCNIHVLLLKGKAGKESQYAGEFGIVEKQVICKSVDLLMYPK